MHKSGYILFLLLLIGITGFAQDKIEREKRIKKEEFPQAALALLEKEFLQLKRLRCYLETDGTARSVEAKFRYKGQKISAEFSEDGHLQDAEVLVKFSKINPKVRSQIKQFLDQQFDRWRIEKTQRQYLTLETPEKTLKRVVAETVDPAVNFELIVLTKKDGVVSRFEMLFDGAGTHQQTRKVIRRAYDFLIF